MMNCNEMGCEGMGRCGNEYLLTGCGGRRGGGDFHTMKERCFFRVAIYS